MKSLWRSAPFWNTASGIRTEGRPEAEMVTGASLLSDLSSNLLIFSMRVGSGGLFAEAGKDALFCVSSTRGEGITVSIMGSVSRLGRGIVGGGKGFVGVKGGGDLGGKNSEVLSLRVWFKSDNRSRDFRSSSLILTREIRSEHLYISRSCSLS